MRLGPSGTGRRSMARPTPTWPVALALAAPRAKILLSTNCTRLTRRALETLARFALKGVRRTADFHTEPPLPDIPAESGAQTLWLFLK